ncbi:MAG: RagB/SusD family nutrient uptake outer membrane protein, partial [Muribaculaceae bacterium]|nr:RagB/SusD family nutrient uptake outer membrane protein [Muribaculaceae bacterium]
TALTEDQIYSSPEYAETSLQNCYKRWRESFSGNLHLLLVGSDEIQSGAYQALKEDGMRRGSLDRYDALLTSEVSYVETHWSNRWPAVGESAKLVKALRPLRDNSDYEGQLYGESCFIRAGLSMELAMIYGRIPILDLERIEQLTYARQPMKDVWQFIIDDLKEAVNYLPDMSQPERANRYAAQMLLGYAYMAAPEETGLRDFTLASQALGEVVNGGPYSLVEYYDLWDYNMKNTQESIFEWQFDNAWPNNNAVQFALGSRAVQSFFGDACYMSGYDHAVPTVWAYSDVEDGGIWEDGDIRRDENIRYDFEYYGRTPDLSNISWEDIGDDHDELKPHIKKYEDFRTDTHSGMGFNNMWNSGKNIPYLRLGNAILLYAEALNEIGQTPEAVKQVNRVRRRAWENSLPADKAWSEGMSQTQFRDEIMTERVRELFGERWRKFDLVRTGKFVEYVKTRNEWAKRSGTIAEYNKVWPLPLKELDQNDDIDYSDQNEGYR